MKRVLVSVKRHAKTYLVGTSLIFLLERPEKLILVQSEEDVAQKSREVAVTTFSGINAKFKPIAS